MTTALREEVSRVRLFAHMLVIGRKRLGEEIARELPFLFRGLLCTAALCSDPAVLLSYLTCLKKQGNNKG